MNRNPSRSSNARRKREPEAKTSEVSEVAVFMGFFDTTARMPYYATFDLAAGAALLGFLAQATDNKP